MEHMDVYADSHMVPHYTFSYEIGCLKLQVNVLPLKLLQNSFELYLGIIN